MLTILDRLERFPRWTLITLAVVINLIIAVIDYISGYDIAFSIFYLAGIVLAAWLVGRRWGLGLAAISTVLWLTTDLLAGQVYTHAWIPYWNAAVRAGFFVIISQSMASLHAALDRAEALAQTDPLTDVANSRAFLEAAASEINRARRYGTCLTLAFLDLDNFKTVNDTQGHAMGDEVLRTIAHTMRTTLRQSDGVGRLGGDEFGVLLLLISFPQATVAIERLQEALLAEMRQHAWPITVSIGAVTWEVPPDSIDELIRQADTLMYSVKQHGKNAIRHEIVRA